MKVRLTRNPLKWLAAFAIVAAYLAMLWFLSGCDVTPEYHYTSPLGRQAYPAGAVVYVPQGYIVMGDVEIGTEKFHDDDPSTGAFVLINRIEGADVSCPWGCTVDNISSTQAHREMMLTGCIDHKGCREVQPYTY